MTTTDIRDDITIAQWPGTCMHCGGTIAAGQGFTWATFMGTVHADRCERSAAAPTSMQTLIDAAFTPSKRAMPAPKPVAPPARKRDRKLSDAQWRRDWRQA